MPELHQMLWTANGQVSQPNITQVPWIQQPQVAQQITQPVAQQPQVVQPTATETPPVNQENSQVNEQAQQDQQPWDSKEQDWWQWEQDEHLTVKDIDKQVEEELKKEWEDKEVKEEINEEEWWDDYLWKVMDTLLKENEERMYDVKKYKKKAEIVTEKYEEVIEELNKLKYDSWKVDVNDEMMPLLRQFNDYNKDPQNLEKQWEYVRQLYNQIAMITWRDVSNEVSSYYTDLKRKITNLSKPANTAWTLQQQQPQQPQRAVGKWVIWQAWWKRF